MEETKSLKRKREQEILDIKEYKKEKNTHDPNKLIYNHETGTTTSLNSTVVNDDKERMRRYLQTKNIANQLKNKKFGF